jgi:hypothetical protein
MDLRKLDNMVSAMVQTIMDTTKPEEWSINEIAMHHKHDNDDHPKAVWTVKVKIPKGFSEATRKMSNAVADDNGEDREEVLKKVIGETMAIFISEGLRGMLNRMPDMVDGKIGRITALEADKKLVEEILEMIDKLAQ